jgi:hypothetical protein
MVAAAGKNGYLYGLSRDLQELFFQVPVTRMENVDAPLTAEGTHFLPGMHGGPNFYGPSYSPPLNALFVPAIDWGSTIKLIPPEALKYNPPKPFTGAEHNFGDHDAERFGHITAVDADSGHVLWKYERPCSRPLLRLLVVCFSLATQKGTFSRSTQATEMSC